VISILD